MNLAAEHAILVVRREHSMTNVMCETRIISPPDSNLCKFPECSQGQFYSIQKEECFECETSCLEECSHQPMCYQCPDSKVFNLDRFQCVESCNSETGILINDTTISDFPFCRSFTYYLNPFAGCPTELGTLKYPYKSLELILEDIYLVHSHSDRTITIKLIEDSTNFVHQNRFIIELNEVIIESYSEVSTVPRKAKLVATNTDEALPEEYTSPTLFKLIKSHNTTQEITNDSKISSADKTLMFTGDSILYIYKTSLTLNNLYITTGFSSEEASKIYLNPIYLGSKTLKIHNSKVLHQSLFVKTSHQMNLEILDTEIDLYKSSGGFDLSLGCFNSDIQSTTCLDGLRLYYSQNFKRNLKQTPPLFIQEGGDIITIKNSIFQTYGELDLSGSFFSHLDQASCSDAPTHSITITNSAMVSPEFTPSFLQPSSNFKFERGDGEWATSIIFDNFTIKDFDLKYSTPIHINHNGFINFVLKNSNFANLILGKNLVKTGDITNIGCKNYIMENVQFDNITIRDGGLCDIVAKNTISVSNIVFTNTQFISSQRHTLLKMEISESGDINISNITISEGIMMNRKTLFELSNTFGATTISNLNITSFNANRDSSYIKLLKSNHTSLNDMVFTNLLPEPLEDVSCVILNFKEISSEISNNITINSMITTNSVVNTLWLSNPSQRKDIDQYILVKGLIVQDVINRRREEMIHLFDINSQGIFKVIFDGLVMRRIIFGITSNEIPYDDEGNVLYDSIAIDASIFSRIIEFHHQTNEQVEIRNSIFEECKNIMIETLPHDPTYHIKTKVAFHNITVRNMDFTTVDFIIIQGTSDILVTNSKFYHNTNIWRGIFIFVLAKHSNVSISDSEFYNNTTPTAALFNVDTGASLTCLRCNMTNNFGLESGVVSTSLGGNFVFMDSHIENNFGYIASVGIVTQSDKSSLVNNCTIKNNFVVSKEQVLNEVLNYDYIPQSFRDFIKNSSSLFEQRTKKALFSIEIGQLEITNNSRIEQTEGVLFSMGSTVNIYNSTFSDLLTEWYFFDIIESNVLLDSIKLKTIKKNMVDYSSIIRSISSNVIIRHSQFENIHIPVIFGSLSSIEMTNLTTLSSFLYTQNMLWLWSCPLIRMKEILVKTTQLSVPLYIIEKSYIQTLEDIFITDIGCSPFLIEKCVLELARNITIVNALRGFKIFESVAHNITSSSFSTSGFTGQRAGGSIIIRRSNVTIENCVFRENQAQTGGAISITCVIGEKCFNYISNTSFIGNIAYIQGGGINYNTYPPILSNVSFDSNIAPYGADIGSYALDIIFEKTNSTFMSIYNVGSGIPLTQNITLKVIDPEHNVMNQLSDGFITLSYSDIAGQNSSSKGILGNDRVPILNGTAVFTDITLLAPPGSQGVRFHVESNKVRNKKAIYNISDVNIYEYTTSFLVDFRYCIPGEMQLNERCIECSALTYSLQNNATKCNNCMDNAQCFGKKDISVDKGYWRKSEITTAVIECPRKESCEGGYHPENEYPVKCQEGYTGPLCIECVTTEEVKYQPRANFQCGKCPNKLMNAIRVIGLQILVLTFLGLIIVVNFKKKTENQLSILLRIFTNYIQLISASISYNIDFPKSFNDLFSLSDRLSSAEYSFFSFDCFIEDYEVKLFAPSNALFKMMLYLILPLFVFLLVSIGIFAWRLFMKMLKPENQYDMKRLFTISFICIMFLFHPTLIFQSLKVFQCIKIDDGESRMIMYIDAQCYSGEHLKWIFIGGLPMILIWVAGMPFLLFVILYKNRNKLEKETIQKYFLIVYQGLKSKCFYWEIFNTFRKFIVLAFNVFLSTADPKYKILCAIISLIIMMKVQERLKPYKNPENNRIEIIGIIAGLITLYCGIVFIPQERALKSLEIASLLLLMGINAYFLLHWGYNVCQYLNYKNKYFVGFLKIYKIMLCQNTPRPKLPDSDFEKEQIPKKKLVNPKKKKIIRKKT
ncbi:unnamed protein product [Moneuplotes crassus]|uniref:TNFR-Cys domain-containing protein n=1 Tax=Euplotes crassus TaxID=5936 RepID=A0AAD1UL39_EUPCR|nr:unnamed protein product [Moneuplotes crassus]